MSCCCSFISLFTFTCVSGAQQVRYISPHRGSRNGGTRITIVGQGKELSREAGRDGRDSYSHFKSDWEPKDYYRIRMPSKCLESQIWILVTLGLFTFSQVLPRRDSFSWIQKMTILATLWLWCPAPCPSPVTWKETRLTATRSCVTAGRVSFLLLVHWRTNSKRVRVKTLFMFAVCVTDPCQMAAIQSESVWMAFHFPTVHTATATSNPAVAASM